MISPLLHVQTDNPFEDIGTKYLEFTVQMNFGTELEVGDRLVPDLRADVPTVEITEENLDGWTEQLNDPEKIWPYSVHRHIEVSNERASEILQEKATNPTGWMKRLMNL